MMKTALNTYQNIEFGFVNLQDYPEEILVNIFKHIMESQYLLHYSNSCKRFHAVIARYPELSATKYMDFITSPNLLEKVPEPIRSICHERLLSPFKFLNPNYYSFFKFVAPNTVSEPNNNMLYNDNGTIRLLARCDLFTDTEYSLNEKVVSCKANENNTLSLFSYRKETNYNRKPLFDNDYCNQFHVLSEYQYNGVSQLFSKEKVIAKGQFEDIFLERGCMSGELSEAIDRERYAIPSDSFEKQLSDAGFTVLNPSEKSKLWQKIMESTYVRDDQSLPKIFLVMTDDGKCASLFSSIYENVNPNWKDHKTAIKGSVVQYVKDIKDGFKTQKYLTSENYEFYFEYRDSDRHSYTALWSNEPNEK